MRSLFAYSLLALALAATAGGQSLDPIPARVLGHPSTTPAEQLLVTNSNPNLGVNGGMYTPEGVAVDTKGNFLYVSDFGNNRVLAWKNATSLTNQQPPKPPDLIIGQPNALTTLPSTSGGLWGPTGLLVDSNANLYIVDSGNNRILRYPAPFANAAPCTPANPPTQCETGNPDLWLGQPDALNYHPANYPSQSAQTLSLSGFQSTLAMDSLGNLFAADAGNRRVLRYPAASLVAGAVTPPVKADLVIGQTSFSSSINAPGGNLDKNILGVPAGLAFDAEGDLFVTDTYSRLVVFPPQVSSAPAGTLGVPAVRFAGVVPSSTAATNLCLATPLECTFSSASYSPLGIVMISGVVMINDGPAVIDTGNNRVLIFDSFGKNSSDWALASGDTTLANPPLVPIAVVGQTSFTGITANAGSNTLAGAATLYAPVAGAVSSTNLFLADVSNNRVLVYPSAPSPQQIAPAATTVLGQGNFANNSPNSIQGKEFWFGPAAVGGVLASAYPKLNLAGSYDADIAVDSTSSASGALYLYVADPNNHRVLGFADARLPSMTANKSGAADLVIGEPDLLTALCNWDGATVPGEALPRQATADSLCYPTGLAVDPATGDLYVADSLNGRVVRFPAPFTHLGSVQKANLVLGQPGFSGTPISKASSRVMLFPYGVIFDVYGRLLVSDLMANRVLVFDPSQNPPQSPASFDPDASFVIGQPDFNSTSPTTFSYPRHIAEDSINQVYVADSGNGRVLVFDLASGNQTWDLTGFNASPDAVAVDSQRNLWAGDATGLYFFTTLPVGGQGSGSAPKPTFHAAAEGACNSLICSNANQSFFTLSAVAISQDGAGNLYVADASNRVGVHYTGLAATNAANSICVMGCNLGGLTESCWSGTPANPLGCGLAPGAFASLYLFGGASFASSSTLNTNPVQVPTTLAGLQVQVSGDCAPNLTCLAPISSVSPSQINAILPLETTAPPKPASVGSCQNAVGYAVAGNCARVQVVNTSTQQVLGSGYLVVGQASPGFFTVAETGFGQIAALNCNHTPCEDTQNSLTNPANQGSVIQLFMTGQGLITGGPDDGFPPSGLVYTPFTPIVAVGGTQATVEFSGLAPGFAGLWQLNIYIPEHPAIAEGFPSGVFPVRVYYDNVYSSPTTDNITPCASATSPTNCATTVVINPPQ